MRSKLWSWSLVLFIALAGCAKGEEPEADDGGSSGGSAGLAGAAGVDSGKGGAGGGTGGSSQGGNAGSGGTNEGGNGGTGGSSAGGSGGADPPNCHVVVNEIMTATDTAPNDEFVEIYNQCSTKITIVGWRLVYRSAAGKDDVILFKFTAGYIDGHSYWIIAGQDWSGPDPKGTFLEGALSAEGGGVGLRDENDKLVDSMGYGTATNELIEVEACDGVAAGISLGRNPNGTDSNNNKADFKAFDTPTPGQAN